LKFLIFGDVFGRIGRKALIKNLDTLRHQYNPDFVLANIDNISSGRWAIEKHLLEIKEAGVDIIFWWDHRYDNEKSLEKILNNEKFPFLRPANLFGEQPWKGVFVWEKNGKKVFFVHLMGEVFMKHSVDNPFLYLKKILKENAIKKGDIVLVDFHRETTAEIYGMGHMFDGQISLLFGTHTHVQTNDEQIFPEWTGFITDVGMVGPKDSVIGADFESVKERFLTGVYRQKIKQSLDNNYVLSFLVAEVDEKTWKCMHINKIRTIWTL